MTGLVVEDLAMRFAGVVALDAVGFQVSEGSITSLIGPNGAGKTTLLNVVSGVLRPSQGAVTYAGRPLHRMKPVQISRSGVRRTFQTVRLFHGLTVLENIVIGQHARSWKAGWLTQLLPFRHGDAGLRREAMEILDQFGLAGKAHVVASELSYGDQRRVEIARALAGRPSLLLLDEPAAGMNETETMRLREDIFRTRDRGVTIFLVEHDMALVMSVSDKVVVLDFGRKIAEGTPAEVKKDPAVISSYLGS